MYLTRFAINPARRGARFLLGSPQRMHAAVLSGFPPGTPLATEDGRVLWRVDRGPERRIELFVASPASPDLTHLVEQAGWPTQETWETRSYGPLLGRLARGQHWAFRLTANPVRHVRREPGRRGKASAHVTVAQQQQWFLDRTAKMGIALTAPDDAVALPAVQDRRTAAFDRRDDQAGHGRVTIAVATFEGVAEVIDPDALRHSLTHGIGRARGYGCGLLTLAPTR